jgi:hypothetical protein
MTLRMRNAALMGAIAALAATAWAASDRRGNSSYVPKYTVIEERTSVTTAYPAPAAPPAIAVHESLSPNETVVTTTQSRPAYVIERPLERTAITVEERRLTRDERIQSEVMDRLAGNPRLDGRIGVETRDSVVRLSGWTRTVGQARAAERDARGIEGVRYVVNEIRPRVGGSV